MTRNACSILIADDEEPFRSTVTTLLEGEGYTVQTTADGVQAINALQQRSYDALLLDVKMPKVDGLEVLKFAKDNSPSTEVIMVTGFHDVKIAVQCMRMGAYDYITKPHSAEELTSVLERALERRSLRLENRLIRSELSRVVGSANIVGQSQAFQKVLEVALKVAPTESTILIQGPSGTGKELVANFILKNSTRAEKPFVAVNCASMTDTLIETELFGHEKGAFTDARAQKQGIVELANRGTLFLDEVGDISLMIQPKLLRFIQTGEFRRVGGTSVLKSDVRIISATNKNLQQEVKEGRYREDLLYRLNVITIEIPRLRERKEDIPLLVDDFLKNKLQSRTKKTIKPEAMELLISYGWPGNVRELENVLERGAILSQGTEIQGRDIVLPAQASITSGGNNNSLGTAVAMKEIEKIHIDGVLRHTRWNKIVSAKILGISLKTLYTKIKQHNISPE
ncbi:MAG: sigma-54 dependent transcriptional regulator [Bacteroidota bacterium]